MYRNRPGFATAGVVARLTKRDNASMSETPRTSKKARRLNGARKALYWLWTVLVALAGAILLLKGVVALVSPTGSAESLFGSGYPLASLLGSLAIVVIGTAALSILIARWLSRGF